MWVAQVFSAEVTDELVPCVACSFPKSGHCEGGSLANGEHIEVITLVESHSLRLLLNLLKLNGGSFRIYFNRVTIRISSIAPGMLRLLFAERIKDV